MGTGQETGSFCDQEVDRQQLAGKERYDFLKPVFASVQYIGVDQNSCRGYKGRY
jgi:hypothetical protein